MHHFNVILTLWMKVLELVDTCVSADCESCLQLLTDGSPQWDHVIVSILIDHGDNRVKAINYLFPSQCYICQIAEPRCPHTCRCVTGVNIEEHRFGDAIFKLGGSANQFEVRRYLNIIGYIFWIMLTERFHFTLSQMFYHSLKKRGCPALNRHH